MSDASSQRMTFALWTVCIIAAIGFAFDIYELLMLPLIIGPALQELGGFARGTPEFTKWFGLLFYVPAVCGGIFGLLGGYLTDRYGRRRVLTWSILLYAFSAFFAGFSTNLWMLLFFRTTTFIGVCVEFVAAVAWLAELFDDPVRREKVLGYTQAFSSIGGLLIAVVNGLIVRHSAGFPAIQIPSFLTPLFGSIGPNYQHADWRYTLMSGLIPAIPLIIIRPFLPESPKWKEKKDAGTLRRPSIRELFSPELRRTTIVTTIMFACSYGVAFGAIQQMPQIVPGINLVKEKVASAAKAAPNEKAAAVASGRVVGETVANYTKSQETGGLFGRFALAMLVAHIASRRALLRIFLVPGLILTPLIFWAFARGEEKIFFSFDMSWLPGFHEVNVSMLGLGIFVAGFFTVAQFSFWGNYLPKAYPVHLRGTGESFAANIGGRMFGTPFAFLTQQIALFSFIPGASPAAKTAVVAAGMALVLFLANLIFSTVLPEQGADHAE
ncbi:MFS transporter [Lacipirellula parvula]|uniref:Putative transmembrane transport protein n=1 Tax=Lacipirellula parvula TaxID=2650471 RepID=A0A5K7XC48_9BACT|nr:MFS transporter [Lacipirellula parvula]BBO34390.1 putative transmembrane transport protein [Lacipirellula parvula]